MIDSNDPHWRAMEDLPLSYFDGREVIIKGSDQRPAGVHRETHPATNDVKAGWWTHDGPYTGPTLAWLEQGQAGREAN